MSLGADRTPAGEDRDRILATLMEEWSPLQFDLMSRLHLVEDEAGSEFVRSSRSEVHVPVIEHPAPSPGRRSP